MKRRRLKASELTLTGARERKPLTSCTKLTRHAPYLPYTLHSGSGLPREPVGEGLLLAGPLQYVKCQSEKFQNFSENF